MTTTTQFPRIGDIVDGLPIGALQFDQQTSKPYALLLGPYADTYLSWDDAVAWAEGLGDGFHLPTRPEGAALFANNGQLGDAAFEPEWHWLGEQYSARYAWGQFFDDGLQDLDPKGSECRARAVRRFDFAN